MSAKESRDGKEGVVWIVGVGASAGLGAALCRRFAMAGLTVVVTGRTVKKIDAVVEEIKAAGGKAIAAAGDVTSEQDLLSTLETVKSLGSLEAAIYNAGGNLWMPTLDMKTDFFVEMWRVVCLGGFIFGREVARTMAVQGRGTILFTGASASLRGKAQFTAFASAKAAVRAVSQSMAREFGPMNIHVAHIVIDGAIDGDRINRFMPQLAKQKGPDGLLNIDAIAEAYWQVHLQQRSAWTQELDLRPYNETW
jgi:NAD(P)-dependent dehydrogenase (short-subunit alcohol dehydrogenase family)